MIAAPGAYSAYYSIPSSKWPGEAWPGNAAPLTLPETGFALGEPYLDWAAGTPVFSWEPGLPTTWSCGLP